MMTIIVNVFVWFIGSVEILVINTLGRKQFHLSASMTSGLIVSQLLGIGLGGLLVMHRVEARRWYRVLPAATPEGAFVVAASRDEAMVVEHLVSIGRRSAMERTAHLLLELYDRLHIVGLADKGAFACPLSQNVLADALGLSTIHVNRVLRQLRDRGRVTVKNQTVVIEDMPATKMLAGYLNRDDGAFPG